MHSDNWPFSEPPNVAVFTTKRVVFKKSWIANVSHDSDDGSWQFQDEQSVQLTPEDASVVSLQEILDLDPSVALLADLPLGWRAWRSSKEAAWQRAEALDTHYSDRGQG
jgi:hypothetical protein